MTTSLKGIPKKPRREVEEIYGVPVYETRAGLKFIDFSEVPVRVRGEFSAFMAEREAVRVVGVRFAVDPRDFKRFMECD